VVARRSHYQRPSLRRAIAGLSGLLTLIQSRDGPEREGAESRLETMPSRPMRQACRKMVAPSSAVCSLRTMRAPAWRRGAWLLGKQPLNAGGAANFKRKGSDASFSSRAYYRGDLGAAGGRSPLEEVATLPSL
jgi:hypothetical protein